MGDSTTIDISRLSPEYQQRVRNLCSECEHIQQGQEVLQQAGVAYLDPTFDRTFKWLMGPEHFEIASTIFDSMVFLTYKGLVTRSVDTIEYGSRRLDTMTEQLKKLPNDLCAFQALSPDVTATLKLLGSSGSRIDDSSGDIVDSTDDDKGNDIVAIVDECIAMLKSEDEIDKGALIRKLKELKSKINDFKSKSEKGDTQAAADIVNFIGRIMIDVEMQRSKQEIIEARALQYGAVMLLSRHASELLPLVLLSICQWENESGDTINDVFHAGIGKNSKNPISISQTTINILQVRGAICMDGDQRKGERKRVKNAFKASLRKRYPELIGGDESFKSLWVPREGDDVKTRNEKQNLRTAYEVLCFLRLAPLTPQLVDIGADKDQNLLKEKEGRLDEWVLRTRIFNPKIREAYNLMNTNNVDTPGAQEQYLGVWSEKDNIQKAVDALVDSLELIKFVPNEQKLEAVSQWADKTFLNSKNLGIRQATIDQIRSRQGEFGNGIVEILEDKYSRAVALGGPATPSITEEDEIRGYPSPTYRNIGSPGRPSGRTSAATLPVTLSPNRKEGGIKKLTDKVADYLKKKDFPSGYYGIEYIQKELSEDPDTLRAIVSRLKSDSKYSDIRQERVEGFEKVVDLFITAPKG
jgi:hypothetical protein